MTNNSEDSNRGRGSLTLHFLRRVEKEAARGIDGVDGVAGALALPVTISSSVWHEEEEGSKEGIKEEIKGSGAKQNTTRSFFVTCANTIGSIERSRHLVRLLLQRGQLAVAVPWARC